MGVTDRLVSCGKALLTEQETSFKYSARKKVENNSKTTHQNSSGSNKRGREEEREDRAP